ncbi:MAG: phasin family protein [Kiloniellaceae bacterium]
MAQKKTTSAARPAPEPAELALTPGKEAGKEAGEEAVEAAAQADVETAEGHEKVVAAIREQVIKAPGGLFEGYDEIAALGKDTIEAYVNCGSIVARGVESLGKEVMDYAQCSLEANLAAAKNLMAVKTLREAIDLQADYTRESFDTMVAEAAKLTEMSVELANQLVGPIQARVNATTRSLFKPLAV